uniref:Uncharacterized protein n=1 Tax=Arundo donax TaxID=35708 RepID=A0A0A9GGV3_ARUDO
MNAVNLLVLQQLMLLRLNCV